MNDPWFVLFGGSSVDGRGEGSFLRRTTDASEAAAHFQKCANDFYSIGYVLKITDAWCEKCRSVDEVMA
jgi:hypothetical protein